MDQQAMTRTYEQMYEAAIDQRRKGAPHAWKCPRPSDSASLALPQRSEEQ